MVVGEVRGVELASADGGREVDLEAARLEEANERMILERGGGDNSSDDDSKGGEQQRQLLRRIRL